MLINFDIGPHHHHNVEAKQLMVTIPLLVHVKPVTHQHRYNNQPITKYWCVSQYLRWANKGHLIMTVGDRETAVVICKKLIDAGFNDNRVEWQDSMQLNRVAAAMRTLGSIYGRWGEKYTYTHDYARKVLPQEDIEQGIVPVYTVAENCGSMVKPDNMSEWWNGWGRYKGVWDMASLYLGDDEQQRFRRIVD